MARTDARANAPAQNERSADPPERRVPGHLFALVAFVVLYLGCATIAAFLRGNREFVFYILFMLLTIGAIGFLHARIRFSLGVLWGLALWGFLHMAGGLVPVPESWPINGDIRVLYSWWIIPDWFKYDHLVHAFGFGVTTWACWQGLGAVVRGLSPAVALRPTIGPLALCVAAGMGFGALNEVVEFFATLLVPETNVGGYVNTGWDLVSNLGGCLLAAFLIARFDRVTPAD